MRFLVLVLITVAFLCCILGAPLPRHVSAFSLQAQSSAPHREHDITIPTKAAFYRDSAVYPLTIPTTDDNAQAQPSTIMPAKGALYPAVVFYPHAAAVSLESREEKASSRKPTIMKTITEWLQGIADDIAGSLPKTKVKQKKKEDDLEQAQTYSKRWAKNLRCDGKGKRVASGPRNECALRRVGSDQVDHE